MAETAAEARRRRELKAIAQFRADEKKRKAAEAKKSTSTRKKTAAKKPAAKKPAAKKTTAKKDNMATTAGKGLKALAGGRARQINAAVKKAKGG